MITLLVTITGALFSIMNPLGTVPIFVGLTQNKAKTEIHGVALWTSVNILIIRFNDSNNSFFFIAVFFTKKHQ